MFGIYSMGVNGVDERGAGDDVSSWAKFGGRFYFKRAPWHWAVGAIALGVAALLVFALRGLKAPASRRN